ncbi:hypothetical protein [Siminovitchia fordii]|uniref:hypothetical protein n=1 Tax=Siminovitchia fordii TaxID=254759 RepID=UPI000368ACBC|nr:hypothetical protein [Siminovitchia fordii]
MKLLKAHALAKKIYDVEDALLACRQMGAKSVGTVAPFILPKDVWHCQEEEATERLNASLYTNLLINVQIPEEMNTFQKALYTYLYQ